jgi:hypothetical protein
VKVQDDSEAQVAVEEKVGKRNGSLVCVFLKKSVVLIFRKVRGMLTSQGKNKEQQPKQAAIRLVEIGPRIEV